jgi:uncharacterized protein YkwD
MMTSSIFAVILFVSAQLTDVEHEMVSLTNEARVAHGLEPLEVDATLMASARKHAEWMGSNGMFHSRLPVGENIAKLQPDVETVHAAWMNSPPHKANILNRAWTHIGVASFNNNGRIYWCVQFSKGN